MKKIMKKAEMGMQTKPKKGKMISESGDLADALNDFNEMKKKGTGPKNNKEAVKYMDDLNTKGKLGTPGIKPKMKMGGNMKKSKDGSSLGMKSVKAGYDSNPGVTRADFVSIGKGEAKMGKSVKKARMHKMPDGSMMKNSMMKMGGAMAKQAAVAIAMKKAGKAPKKKMQYGGEAASMAPTMKSGGAMKKCKYGCK